MHTPLPQLIPQRIARVRREVAAAIWQKVSDLPVQGSPVLTEPVDEPTACTLHYTPVVPGTFFGPPRGDWNQRWFSLTVRRPPRGVVRHLFWCCQGETTAYYRGQPWAGLDGGHLSCPVPPGGGRLLLDCGTYQTGDWAFTRENISPYGLRFDGAYLADRNEAAWQAHHDLEILTQLMQRLLAQAGWNNVQPFGYQPDLVRASPLLRRLLAGFEEAAEAWGAGGAAALRVVLENMLRAFPAETWQPRAIMAGHSHLDLVFMWPEREGERKGVHTIATMLQLTKSYPEFHVTWTQPALLHALKKRAPGLMRAVQRQVRAGRWELTGGMEVEAENQIPCGESLARCLIYGQQRLAELKGGKPSTVVWMPDCFGFTACLPQLMVQTGLTGFLSGKMGWSQITRVPQTSFIWRGCDGSEVVAHHSPAPVSNADVASLANAAEQDRQCGTQGEFMGWIGMGDGGGGTTESDIERLRRLANLSGVPRAAWGKAEDFFARLESRRSQLPVYQGEMYLEYHRGTYTTQSDFKAAYRELERALQTHEAARVLAGRKALGFPAWQRLLFAQFHDALPGSSITLVYEQLTAELRQLAGKHREDAQRLVAGHGQGWSVFNPLPLARRQVVNLGTAIPANLVDPRGVSVPTQRCGKGRTSTTWALLDLPPTGSVAVYPAIGRKKAAAPALPLAASPRLLDNGRVQAHFTAEGCLERLVVDGQDQPLTAPAGLFLHPDHPANFDAWDIDRETVLAGDPIGVALHVAEAGPVRVVLAGEGAIGKASRVAVRYILEVDSRWLRIEADVDWHEAACLLKFRVPTRYQGRMARFGLPFGSILRSQLPGQPADEAMWEVPGNRWAAVLDDAQQMGVALVTEARYGFSCREGVLAVSLLRAPMDSSENRPRRVDQGLHHLHFAVSAHRDVSDDVQESTAAAAELLYGETVVAAGASARTAGISLKQAGSLVASWITPAETTSGVLLRLHETAGAAGQALICLEPPRQKVTLVDLRERRLHAPVKVAPGQWRIDYAPYQVLTVLVAGKSNTKPVRVVKGGAYDN